MEGLIKITQTENGYITSARDLHFGLEVKTEFSKWCKRMFEYGFEENVDYTLVKIGEGKMHNKTDYALTIDTAKEISMLQRTEKGKEVRAFYIKFVNDRTPIVEVREIFPSLPTTYLEALKDLVVKEEKIILLEEKNEKLQYRSDFVDVCFDADGVFKFGDVAKLLKLDYGSITLYEKMRKYGLIMKGSTIPYQKYVNNGWFKVVEELKPVGNFNKLIATTYATQKGIGYIKKLLDDNNE